RGLERELGALAPALARLDAGVAQPEVFELGRHGALDLDRGERVVDPDLVVVVATIVVGSPILMGTAAAVTIVIRCGGAVIVVAGLRDRGEESARDVDAQERGRGAEFAGPGAQVGFGDEGDYRRDVVL